MKLKAILHLAKANLNKNKINNLSLALLIAIVTGIAALGLSIMTQINTAYDAKTDELNSLHFAYAVPRAEYKASYEDFFKNDPRVAEYSAQPGVLITDVHINVGGEIDAKIVFLNTDSPNPISPFRPLANGQSANPAAPALNASAARGIYLPYIYRLNGYRAGDDFTFQYKNKDYTYTIAGFFESADFAKVSNSSFKYYLTAPDYRLLADQLGESTLLMVRLHDPAEVDQLEKDFFQAFDIEIDLALTVEQLYTKHTIYKNGDMMLVLIIGSTLIAFAFIAAPISFLIINFRVKNSIIERMHNIGVLGAAGYTARAIKWSIIGEYALIAFPAALVGGLLAGLFIPFINTILLTATGLFLSLVPNPALSVITALFAGFLLLLMVLPATRSIRRLPPVMALRGGLGTHNFRRNYLPLHKGPRAAVGRFYVDIKLGLKNIFVYGRLYLMVALTIAGTALMITAVAILYVNFSLNRETIINLSGMETADVTLNLAPHTDAASLISALETMPGVRKTSMLDIGTVRQALHENGEPLFAYISDDFSRMEIMRVYQGQMPVWDNEIATTESYANSLGKELGDVISLKKNGIVKDYLLTGYLNSINNGGYVVVITLDGIRRMVPDYQQQAINIYLAENVDYDSFVTQIKDRFGIVNIPPALPADDPYRTAKLRVEEKIAAYLEQYGVNSLEYAVSLRGEIIMEGSSSVYRILKIVNWNEYLDTQVGSFGTGMSSLLGVIILISLALISLILFMTNRTIITKRRSDFGILKAGGFQTRQLLLQMLFSFVPSALTGSLLGCLSGALIIKPVLLAVLSANGGIANLELLISPAAILLICLGIFLVTVTVTALSALRIRKISPYQLISE